MNVSRFTRQNVGFPKLQACRSITLLTKRNPTILSSSAPSSVSSTSVSQTSVQIAVQHQPIIMKQNLSHAGQNRNQDLPLIHRRFCRLIAYGHDAGTAILLLRLLLILQIRYKVILHFRHSPSSFQPCMNLPCCSSDTVLYGISRCHFSIHADTLVRLAPILYHIINNL